MDQDKMIENLRLRADSLQHQLKHSSRHRLNIRRNSHNDIKCKCDSAHCDSGWIVPTIFINLKKCFVTKTTTGDQKRYTPVDHH